MTSKFTSNDWLHHQASLPTASTKTKYLCEKFMSFSNEKLHAFEVQTQ